MKVPLCIPDISKSEEELVLEALRTGQVSHGKYNKHFEEKLKEYLGVREIVLVNSCASALDLSVLTLPKKGEIILPSFTFPASANAIVNGGCKPIFADIYSDTCNLSIEDTESKITENTVAIMPIHFAGQICDMDKLMKLASKHNLTIIEDSAECLGGTFNNKKAGTFGIGCFSFWATKNITTGEGGAIATNNEQLANKMRALSAHGISTSHAQREASKLPWHRSSTFAGHNFRMSGISAALGVAQLSRLDEFNNKRIEHAKYYIELLSELDGVTLSKILPNCKHVYQMFTIKVDPAIRDKLVMHLRENEIGASVHFDPPVHQQDYYKQDLELPNTMKVCKSIITLPMYPRLSKKQIEYVVNKIKEYLKCK